LESVDTYKSNYQIVKARMLRKGDAGTDDSVDLGLRWRRPLEGVRQTEEESCWLDEPYEWSELEEVACDHLASEVDQDVEGRCWSCASFIFGFARRVSESNAVTQIFARFLRDVHDVIEWHSSFMHLRSPSDRLLWPIETYETKVAASLLSLIALYTAVVKLVRHHYSDMEELENGLTEYSSISSSRYA
jgi:hypothetical protein